MDEKYKVYISDSECSYCGMALIGAKTADEANEYIRKYKEFDKKNEWNSFGMSFVDEDDAIEGVYSEGNGIIINRITYSGW